MADEEGEWSRRKQSRGETHGHTDNDGITNEKQNTKTKTHRRQATHATKHGGVLAFPKKVATESPHLQRMPRLPQWKRAPNTTPATTWV